MHVGFEILFHLEGDIAMNTRFVFSLHFHGVFLYQQVRIGESGSKVGRYLETLESISKVKPFFKSEGDMGLVL